MPLKTNLLGVATALALCLGAGAAPAQTIYPIDRADILAGARFDLKVEFPAGAEDVRLTINGQDAQALTGAKSEIIRNEEGAARSALWLRDASLKILAPTRSRPRLEAARRR